VERDESPSADEVMASFPDIDQQNKLQLPKIASFSGLLESDDPFIDGFLKMKPWMAMERATDYLKSSPPTSLTTISAITMTTITIADMKLSQNKKN